MIIEKIYLQEGISPAVMTAYIQESNSGRAAVGGRPAVLICPGGAFIGISADEGEPVALRFASEGFHAFVLEYSIGVGAAAFPNPFLDAARALCHIRQNVQRWALDPQRIALCGFSTGGYVAAAFSARWHEPWISEALGLPSDCFRPDSLILGYPVLDLYRFQCRNHRPDSPMNPTIEMMNTAIFNNPFPEREQVEAWNFRDHITTKMPPTFLWSLGNDAYIDPAETLDFARSLVIQNIPYELHAFQGGSHGMSLGNQTVGYDFYGMKRQGNAIAWFDMAICWLREMGQGD